MEKFRKPASKLYQNQYVFIGSGIIFTGSSIILILVYEIFPIGKDEEQKCNHKCVQGQSRGTDNLFYLLHNLYE